MKPGCSEARLLPVRSRVRIARPEAGILRAARPRSNHTHQEPPANSHATPDTINAAVVPAAKKPGFAQSNAQPGTTEKKPGFAEARLLPVRSRVRIARPEAGILRAARPRSNHTHQEPPANSHATPDTINATVVPAAKKPGFAQSNRQPGTTEKKPGFAEARLLPVPSRVRIARPEAGILRAARPRSNHTHQEPPANSHATPDTINATVVPAAKSPASAQSNAQPGTTGKKPGFAEARLLPVRSRVRIARPEAGILRCQTVLKPHAPRAACELPRHARHHQRRGGTRCEKARLRAKQLRSRARPRRSRALPKPGFFPCRAGSESPGQKPGFSALPDRAQTTRTKSRLRTPTPRQTPSTPRWYPLRKSPASRKATRSRARPRRSRALPKPGFFPCEQGPNRQARSRDSPRCQTALKPHAPRAACELPRHARHHQRRGGTRCQKSPASRKAARSRARPRRSRALPKPGLWSVVRSNPLRYGEVTTTLNHRQRCHERSLFPVAVCRPNWRGRLRQGHRDLQVREDQTGQTEGTRRSSRATIARLRDR